jgi:putative transposase
VTVPVVWSRDLPSEPASVRVYRDSLGHWYASFVVTRAPAPAPAADAAIGAAKRALTECGQRAGRKVVLVPPAYTTMTCSECFARNKLRLRLDERTFRCESRGHTAGRDRNAARVILATAERGHAGADDVRHPSRLLPVAGGMRSEPESPRP